MIYYFKLKEEDIPKMMYFFNKVVSNKKDWNDFFTKKKMFN